MVAQLELGDYASLFAYFIVVIGFGIWSSCKNRGSVQGYFLAGRSMHFIPIGASLFASNIGSGHFIGLAGSGTSSGVAVAGYELTATIPLLFLGWIFLPVYLRSGVYTMPEYLKKRFGGDRIRITLTVFSLIAYIFTKISVDLYSGALFIKLSLDLNIYVSIGILILIAGLFTIGGGLSAVIWTDFIQSIIMIIGALYLMITSFARVGGYSEMKIKYGYSVAKSILLSNSTCGLPPKDYFDLIRNVNSDIPWTGIGFGLTVIAVWYWCTDQVIVQRVLAAKSLNHAKAGCLFAAILKFLPLFLIVYPGMIARIFYKDDVMCADSISCENYCGNPNGCSNVAYPRMVIDLMPVGARGLMLAVMMAALMSSLTSVFNSSSTIFTIDIYKRVRTSAEDWELLIAGRLFVVVLLVFSILSIPIIESSKDGRLFDYIQAIQSFMAPPICSLFVMAVTFKRVNESGSFWGLVCGFLLGTIRFIWQSLYDVPKCTHNFQQKKPNPPFLINMHFLHFSIFSFFLTSSIILIISIFTKPIPKKYITGLTFTTSKIIFSEPIEIPSGKGFGENNFCSKADLSINEDDEILKIVSKESKNKKNDIKKPIKKMNLFKTILFRVCGVESDLKKDEKIEQNSKEKIDYLEFNNTDPYWSKICDRCALAVLMITGFILAFFNKYP